MSSLGTSLWQHFHVHVCISAFLHCMHSQLGESTREWPMFTQLSLIPDRLIGKKGQGVGRQALSQPNQHLTHNQHRQWNTPILTTKVVGKCAHSGQCMYCPLLPLLWMHNWQKFSNTCNKVCGWNVEGMCWKIYNYCKHNYSYSAIFAKRVLAIVTIIYIYIYIYIFIYLFIYLCIN